KRSSISPVVLGHDPSNAPSAHRPLCAKKRKSMRSNDFALPQSDWALQCVAGDLILAEECCSRVSFCISEKVIPGSHHLRCAADAIVCADRHHAAAIACLLVELIEIHLDLVDEFRRGIIAAF